MTQHDIAQLFDTQARTVYRYIYFRVGNQADAEDITSAVFEKVVRYHHTFHEQNGATSRSWLFAIARSVLSDHFRKKHGGDITTLDDSVDIPSPDASPAVVADTVLTWESVMQGIALLPQRQQEIVLLKYQSDLSNTEIATVLGIDQHTVGSAASKAIARLRSLFTSRL